MYCTTVQNDYLFLHNTIQLWGKMIILDHSIFMKYKNAAYGYYAMKAVAFFLLIINMCGCTDSEKPPAGTAETVAPSTPLINYAVAAYLPHDTSMFTEGLLVHNGQLFESSGAPEDLAHTKTLIGMVDSATGKINKKIELDRDKYFGEGIVFFNDKLYQLTYKTQVGFIYDAKSFKQTGKFKYRNAEGWGLTTNGTDLIMSDGTDTLTFLNPSTLQEVKILTVTENGSPLMNLNELEYIKGFIYANVWETNYIVKIDPSNGKVLGKLDLTSLTLEAKNKNTRIDALNGIAYDAVTDKIYVTGKFWPNIYQINFAH